MPEKYFQILIKLAEQAYEHDEVPISAILVKDDKIIAKAYNTKESTHNVTNHAEMLVIKKASGKLKTWHLEDCDIYVTLKPCPMCESALKQAHIRNVYYLLDKLDYKKEYTKTKIVKANIRTQKDEYYQYLKGFFQKKRDKS